MSTEIRRLLERAREATGTFRDAAREGRVIEFRQRDPLVIAIHRALDELEALLASQRPPTEERSAMPAGWGVRVSVFDDLVVSISERELAGRELSAADEDLIRGCARHLLSFVGAPAEPSPADPPPEDA